MDGSSGIDRWEQRNGRRTFRRRIGGVVITKQRFVDVGLAFLALLSLITLFVKPIHGHPGAVADGRGSCGTEYSTPTDAYRIPDVTEAWYVRRLSTCESNQFWTTFDITTPNQPLYIAVISPEIERFQDNIQFHAILYGPGVTANVTNGLLPVPDVLPEGIAVSETFKDGDGSFKNLAYMKSPTTLDTCDFVDTNPIMRDFSDVIEGRCMEEFTFSDTHSDALQRSSTVMSWWIYSFNHEAAEPGTYYLQSWLTTRTDPTTVAQGKYEITIGPWFWSGYATDATLDLAQSQGTTCSCAVNANDYREQHLDRLGNIDPAFFISQLPGGSCTINEDNGGYDQPSACYTIPEMPYVSDGSSIEWVGLFDVEGGVTYEWTFHSYAVGDNGSYEYPDPGMFVYAVPTASIDAAVSDADVILTNAVESGVPSDKTISEGQTIPIGEPCFISFTDVNTALTTTVLVESPESITLALFTQHVPSEFMAHALREQASQDYVHPSASVLYVEAEEVQEGDTDKEGNESSSSAALSHVPQVLIAFIASLFLIMSSF